MNWAQAIRSTVVGLVAMVLIDLATLAVVPSIAMDWGTRLMLYVLWPVVMVLFMRFGHDRKPRRES